MSNSINYPNRACANTHTHRVLEEWGRGSGRERRTDRLQGAESSALAKLLAVFGAGVTCAATRSLQARAHQNPGI